MKIKNRDEFSQKNKLELAKRVGFVCSNPDCRTLTIGPTGINANNNTSINLGEAAHITAAAEGGPRFNGDLTADQRSNITNGIWLCSNCAKLIDSDVISYPASLLREWKLSTESETRKRLGIRETSSTENITYIYDRRLLIEEMISKTVLEYGGGWAGAFLALPESFYDKLKNMPESDEVIYDLDQFFRLCAIKLRNRDDNSYLNDEFDSAFIIAVSTLKEYSHNTRYKGILPLSKNND